MRHDRRLLHESQKEEKEPCRPAAAEHKTGKAEMPGLADTGGGQRPPAYVLFLFSLPLHHGGGRARGFEDLLNSIRDLMAAFLQHPEKKQRWWLDIWPGERKEKRREKTKEPFLFC